MIPITTTNDKKPPIVPGNRFPWWVIPVVLIGCAAVYFGTRRQDIRTPEETAAVPIASDAAPFGELNADGTESASEATVTSVPATALPSFFDRFTALRTAWKVSMQHGAEMGFFVWARALARLQRDRKSVV